MIDISESAAAPRLSELPVLDVSLGELAAHMGVRFHVLTADYSVASMPVAGNRQPFGLLHGGAHLVLGEYLGSMSANAHAGEGKVALGVEISASHTRGIRDGMVVGTCRAISLGRRLTVHEIAVTDEAGNRLSTVRMTNMIAEARPE